LHPDDGQRVHVYYRLTQGDLSIRNTDRIVIANVDRVVLREAEFRVQPAGHQKCVDEGVRNVHAFVYGTYTNEDPPQCDTPVRYNPFEAAYFQTVEEGSRVDHSEWVIIEGKRCYIP